MYIYIYIYVYLSLSLYIYIYIYLFPPLRIPLGPRRSQRQAIAQQNTTESPLDNSSTQHIE